MMEISEDEILQSKVTVERIEYNGIEVDVTTSQFSKVPWFNVRGEIPGRDALKDLQDLCKYLRKKYK